MRFAIAATISWMSSPPTGPTQAPPRISPVFGIRQQFHKTILRFHDERFAVVIEWITRGEKFYSVRRRFFFSQANGRDLRIGEHDGNAAGDYPCRGVLY